ncbi:transposable element Tcb1 transposase [Trichonephila clavipes]|nr:transposable element Tcb1 transposase [Trichonephila clavipes]
MGCRDCCFTIADLVHSKGANISFVNVTTYRWIPIAAGNFDAQFPSGSHLSSGDAKPYLRFNYAESTYISQTGKSVVVLDETKQPVMRICDRWMQEDKTDRRGRSHPPQCTTSREERQIVRMAVMDRSVTSRTVAQHFEYVTYHLVFARTSLRGERILNSCVMHRHTGPAPGIVVWGGIGYHSRNPLVRNAGTLNSQRYISEVLEPVVLPYLQGLDTAIFQQDNALPHVARIFQGFFVNHQIESLPWPARSPVLSPIENMWSMVAQRLTQITPPAASPDQLWQRVEAIWCAVPQEHIQSL